MRSPDRAARPMGRRRWAACFTGCSPDRAALARLVTLDRRRWLVLLLAATIAGAIAGAIVTKLTPRPPNRDILRELSDARRQRLPSLIILVRHGQSEGNADETLYRNKADNRMELTKLGSIQSVAAGKRIKELAGEQKVRFYVSPFERTLQTARNILFTSFNASKVVDVSVDPRIREQEFGNLQGTKFKFYKQAHQEHRFWYRFPTGESGADVYDRTTQWWDSAMRRHTRERASEIVVVVTHGLTMRLILMQLFHWSPNTFHTVWNPSNCGVYVLRKDLSVKGEWPYVLDEVKGDKVASSIDLVVEFRNGEKKTLQLQDYLSIAPPRTLQFDTVRDMLARQHGLDPAQIESIDFFGGTFQKHK
ncbi:unnamed protein product [Polarella glacialis]|uniref:Histidine phosphatase family protein n=1 Tax=Polarella glacialis TaxID=89957 RepID=A0A813DX95_POLGL|nr:unnamed protein product [Polarella glacialis]